MSFHCESFYSILLPTDIAQDCDYFWEESAWLSDMLNYVTLVRRLDILYYAINADVSMTVEMQSGTSFK